MIYKHYSDLIAKSISLYDSENELVTGTIQEVIARVDQKEVDIEEEISEKFDINIATFKFL